MNKGSYSLVIKEILIKAIRTQKAKSKTIDNTKC